MILFGLLAQYGPTAITFGVLGLGTYAFILIQATTKAEGSPR